jgi:hypothetical protein
MHLVVEGDDADPLGAALLHGARRRVHHQLGRRIDPVLREQLLDAALPARLEQRHQPATPGQIAAQRLQGVCQQAPVRSDHDHRVGVLRKLRQGGRDPAAHRVALGGQGRRESRVAQLAAPLRVSFALAAEQHQGAPAASVQPVERLVEGALGGASHHLPALAALQDHAVRRAHLEAVGLGGMRVEGALAHQEGLRCRRGDGAEQQPGTPDPRVEGVVVEGGRHGLLELRQPGPDRG